MGLFFSCVHICNTVNKVPLACHLLKNIWRFRDIFILDASVYKQLNTHTKTYTDGRLGGEATRTQELFRLIGRQQRGERFAIFAEAGSSLQIVVHKRASICMAEDGILVQPILTVYLDEIVRCVVCEEKRDEINKIVKTLLGMFSQNGIELPVDLLKEKLQGQYLVQSVKIVCLSVSRSRFAAGGYTSCLKDCVEERRFIRDIPELWSQVRHVLTCDNLGPSNKCYCRG